MVAAGQARQPACNVSSCHCAFASHFVEVDGCCAPARTPGLAFLPAVAAGFLTFLHVVTKLKRDSSPSGTDLPASSCFFLSWKGSFDRGKAASSETPESDKAKG